MSIYSDFEPSIYLKTVEHIEKYNIGDLVNGSNFAVISVDADDSSRRGVGLIEICQSRARDNCLRCVRRMKCHSVDLKM